MPVSKDLWTRIPDGCAIVSREFFEKSAEQIFRTTKSVFDLQVDTYEKEVAANQKLRREKYERLVEGYFESLKLTERAFLDYLGEVKKAPSSFEYSPFPRLFLGEYILKFGRRKRKLPIFQQYNWDPLRLEFENDDEQVEREFLETLLASFLACTCAKQVRLVGIDLSNFGQRVSFLHRFDEIAQVELVSTEEDLEDFFGVLADEIKSRQKSVLGDYRSFDEYLSENNLEEVGPMVIMVRDSGAIPDHLIDKLSKFLQSDILGRCGIGVWSVETIANQSVSTAETKGMVTRSTEGIVVSWVGEGIHDSEVSSSALRYPALAVEVFGQFEDAVKRNQKPTTQTRKLEYKPAFDRTSSEGVSVALGLTPAGNPISLDLSTTSGNYNALVGGGVGSGKSVLLHNIIVGLSMQYSPSELRLCLLDFKEGTEFSIYRDLPHVRILSTESSVTFGIEVLKWMQEEITRRAERFKAVGESDLVSYREKTGEKMPRIIMIADEFQRLLDVRNAGNVDGLVDDLIRRGRSFGFHFIFATQSLYDINLTTAASSNLATRICLRISEMDAAKIMHPDNILASTFTEPGLAVINNNGGLPGHNQEFKGPYFGRDKLSSFVAEIGKLVDFPTDRLIYSGQQFAEMPSCPDTQHDLIIGIDQSVLREPVVVARTSLNRGIVFIGLCQEKVNRILQKGCSAKLTELDFSNPTSAKDAETKTQLLLSSLDGLQTSEGHDHIVLISNLKRTQFLRPTQNPETFMEEPSSVYVKLQELFASKLRYEIGLIFVVERTDELYEITNIVPSNTQSIQFDPRDISYEIYLDDSEEMDNYNVDINEYQVALRNVVSGEITLTQLID